MLNFTQAIEEMKKAGADDTTLALAEALKNMTAADVHATTALSTKKPTTLKEMLGGEDDGEDAAKSENWSMPITVIKADADQQMIFGWASVSEISGELVVDKQDDIITPDELEKAAYEFVLYSRIHSDMHGLTDYEKGDVAKPKQVGRLVESMMFTKEKQDVLGIDLGLQGWWVGFKVDSKELWAAHKRGERPEFSIGGTGQRVAV